MRKYLKRPVSVPKPAIPPAGSEGPKPATHPPAPGTPPSGNDHADSAAEARESKPAIPPTGSPGENGVPSGPEVPADGASGAAITPQPEPSGVDRGRPSACQPYRTLIEEKLDLGLSAQRIFQDLVGDHGFVGSYDSVKRFVRRLGRRRELPMRRMECVAGAEAQVDFGTGAPVVGPDGKRRKTHVFRIVLSHSRKAYSEATYRQTTDDFIRCVENALWHFGGCPQVLVIDNLRAAVKHPDWFDPELVPKLRSFCQHYGIAILPTKPYMPRHKGKVEASVKYVQSNALKAKKFSTLPEENDYLAHWETAVADTRIHGTTRQHVGRVFREVERAALQPLPAERFPSFQEAPRKVNRDGHVEVAKAYYSTPPEYLGHEVWARWDGRVVRIFNHRFEQIAFHLRHEQGRFSTHAQHLAPEKINGIERGAGYLLRKVGDIGPHTQQWAEAMLHARGIEGTRVLQGVLSLTRRHRCDTLEKACETALSYEAFHLRTLRQLIARQAEPQTALPFLDAHPIIRPLADYASVVAAALRRQDDRRRDRGAGFRRDGEGVRGKGEQKGSPDSACRQGCSASSTRLRSGYPSLGCSSAEPNSVSPDVSSVLDPCFFHHSNEENESHA